MEQYRSSSRVEALEDEAAERLVETRPNALSMVISDDTRDLVRNVLDGLNERDRSLLRAVFLEERDKDEICAEFGVDRDYLRVLLHRAKGSFRAIYSKRVDAKKPRWGLAETADTACETFVARRALSRSSRICDMNHQDGLQEMAVERYLLGELSGASLDSFEEHLFECSECAMDVKTGVIFIDGARTELGAPRRVAVKREETAPRWTSWFTSPWILAPALAACLLLLAFQTFVIQPRIKLEIAQAQAPAVLNPLVLANAGARGDSVPEIVAPKHGSFVISLDVPTNGRLFELSLLRTRARWVAALANYDFTRTGARRTADQHADR